MLTRGGHLQEVPDIVIELATFGILENWSLRKGVDSIKNLIKSNKYRPVYIYMTLAKSLDLFVRSYMMTLLLAGLRINGWDYNTYKVQKTSCSPLELLDLLQKN